MTQFQTLVEIIPSSVKTDYSRTHVFIGSCFTENIGAKMKELKFKTDINPFGILYNPVSISQCIKRLISGKEFGLPDLFNYGSMWHSYSHHGRFSGISPEAALLKINERFMSSKTFLLEAGFLLLTFGTAWVYELKSTGVTVSNCHKVPSSEFKRYKLSVSEIVTEMRGTLEQLWNVNPGIKVILTVSPVRHLKDGAVENQLSKSTLLLSVDALIRGFGEEHCSYFPAYELMMDELRDYRFYGDDMVHPSPVAVDFIWEKFRDWLIDKESQKLSGKIFSLLQARNHLPVNPETPEFFLFVKNSLAKTLELAKKYPFLDFSDEIEYFANKIRPHELR
jgi:hypothetical protein